MSEALRILAALLRGEASAADAMANTLRTEALGFAAFGRTDALDLFAAHPLALSATPHVLESSRALAVLDATHDGRLFGVYAELADGVLARVWVAGATAADARCEPAVPLARDDFLSQLRVPCQGDARDHPGIDAARWPAVLALGTEALAASSTNGRPIAASSSRAVVMHAFGADGRFAALYDLRILEDTSPRRSHRRLALAAARCDGAGTVLHSRLAISDALPTPAMAIF